MPVFRMFFVRFYNTFLVRSFTDKLSVKVTLKYMLNMDYFLKIDVSFAKLVKVNFVNGNPIADYKGEKMMEAFFMGGV